MAKGINIFEYRGLKARRNKTVVLHLTAIVPEDVKKGKLRTHQKIHLRFNWEDWCELVNDINQPISEWDE
jgi:hypothetical protein